MSTEKVPTKSGFRSLPAVPMRDNGSAPEGAGNTTPGLDPHHLYDRKC